MKANIPEIPEKRIAIIGGGFAGLRLIRNLVRQKFQPVLNDRTK
jgi:NADH dehydrogenase FAD-containing subunit